MSEDVRDEDAHREAMKKLKAEQDAKARSKRIKRGVLIVNTGDGKGKSTAAFGMAMRAAGHGQRVGLIQFVKGKWRTGEQEAIKRFPEIEHIISGEGFTWNSQDHAKDVAAARRGWDEAIRIIEASRGEEPEYNVLILDELNIALRADHLPVDEVVAVLADLPRELSVVVTGRGAPAELIEIAHTVTEMVPVKHAFEVGIQARKGVDF
ncbi:MAG: cob(I)alamin adenosyltransferase [Myxococcota bacterium]|jgi:cob(I)alamin adenosyltransferase